AGREGGLTALPGRGRTKTDPHILYPNISTAHTRALPAEGRVVEKRQPHMRGGAHEPLTRGDIEEKFALNARHGGWGAARAQAALALMRTLFDGKIDLSSFRGEALCVFNSPRACPRLRIAMTQQLCALVA